MGCNYSIFSLPPLILKGLWYWVTKVVLVYKRVILPIHLQGNENISRRLILKNKNVSLISLVVSLNGRIRSLL